MNKKDVLNLISAIRFAGQSNLEGVEHFVEKIIKKLDDLPEMKVIYLDHYVGEKLKYKKAGDSGFDVRAATKEQVFLAPGQRVKIPLGFKTEIPEGYEVQMRPRSGLAISCGISMVNSPGTIDEGWRGEWAVIMINHGDVAVIFKPGDRIAQGVLATRHQVEFKEIFEEDSLSETERGDNGFGSTGLN